MKMECSGKPPRVLVRHERGAGRRYAVAAAVGLLAIVVAHALPTLAELKVPVITFSTLLVGLCAWYGGLWPGLVCTALCAFGVAVWLEPPNSLAVDAPEEIAGLAMFAMVGAGLSAICEQLHRSRQAERAARVMRDEVMAMVAHDLRSPLGAIELGVAAIERDAGQDPAGEAVRRRAAVLHRIVSRMGIMLRDLLDTAALDQGKLFVDPAPEPCDGLLRDTEALFSGEAEARAVRLATEAPSRAPRVLADHDRVLQVLSNLTSNALKFTPKGGSVTIRAEPVDHYVRFTVRDTGRGLSDEELSHLFERFSRAPRAQGGSTGLGLCISKAIVEAHGGTIRAESEKGRGSTFSFTLRAE